VRSERGYTLIEMLIVVAMIGIASAIAVPVFIESNARSAMWTGSERIGATIRQARLRAISTNTAYRVAFNCPSAGDLRLLIVTGDPGVDDDFPDRCSADIEGDSEVEMPPNITFDSESATALQVSGRGNFTAIGDSIPLTISVYYGTSLRTLTVSTTGQITFANVH
jgi:prepilin-type N-terminal cleavage/methylation domain-containing protein